MEIAHLRRRRIYCRQVGGSENRCAKIAQAQGAHEMLSQREAVVGFLDQQAPGRIEGARSIVELMQIQRTEGSKISDPTLLVGKDLG